MTSSPWMTVLDIPTPGGQRHQGWLDGRTDRDFVDIQLGKPTDHEGHRITAAPTAMRGPSTCRVKVSATCDFTDSGATPRSVCARRPPVADPPKRRSSSPAGHRMVRHADVVGDLKVDDAAPPPDSRSGLGRKRRIFLPGRSPFSADDTSGTSSQFRTSIPAWDPSAR